MGDKNEGVGRLERVTSSGGDAHSGLSSGGVYVASRASEPARPAMWRALREQGHPIISTWIDEAGAGETQSQGELWERIEREVTTAERLVLYAEPDDFPLKGAYVEVGMALAAGVPVYVVIPGVVLSVPTMRPLGSWAAHPAVKFCATVEAALAEERRGVGAPVVTSDAPCPAVGQQPSTPPLQGEDREGR